MLLTTKESLLFTKTKHISIILLFKANHIITIFLIKNRYKCNINT